MNETATRSETISDPRKLGAFLGVFTPSILTILGVIMYLRFGWVVGNEGLIRTLFIVVIANSITLITAFSVSAVATNMRVGVGGAYYIISRSLGLEIGGAIGLPLFLSQALSITLYSFGLAESLRFVWPDAPIQIMTAIIIIAITLLSLRGADLALKAQLPIMVGIGLSLLSLALGAGWRDHRKRSSCQHRNKVPGSGLCLRCFSPPSPESSPGSACPAIFATPSGIFPGAPSPLWSWVLSSTCPYRFCWLPVPPGRT